MLPLTIAARLIVAIALVTATEHEFIGRAVRISDGDTLVVLDAQNEQHKVRLYGIDAS